MVELTLPVPRFKIFLSNLFTPLLVAESLMVLISAVIPTLIVGIAAGAMMFGLFMCVQGAFISLDKIGWWLRWIQYITVHFYGGGTRLDGVRGMGKHHLHPHLLNRSPLT